MASRSHGSGSGELRRHWRILPPCLAGITLCSVHGYSLGVMIPVIEREYGWPRAEISLGLMFISVIALFAAPLVGLAIDRFGPRRIALTGILLFCFALAMLSNATADIRSWWLLWLLLGAGNMLILPTVWTKAINVYFDASRGIALALALCGTGVTAAFVPSLTNALVEHFGWRGAYIGLGLIGAGITFPIAWFLFRPEAAGRAAPAASRLPPQGISVREGFARPSFLKLAGATLLFSITICALTTNLVPVLLARGMTPATAAWVAGLLGIGSITGRLVGGILLDRFDAARVGAVSVLMPVVTVSLLLAFPGAGVAAAACLILGLSVGTEVDCCAYLAARHFGLKSFGTLFGTMNGLMLFGNGIAPVLANHVYDVTGSYDIVLWAQVPACLGTALLFLLLGPYPQPDAVEASRDTAPAGGEPA
ncbi:MAG: MFS transporter [Novosphingobium sp.]|jgi:predicted MFS family arabinose efflux permease|nr:MFS transporter [Novosphingobium sp.]